MSDIWVELKERPVERPSAQRRMASAVASIPGNIVRGIGNVVTMALSMIAPGAAMQQRMARDAYFARREYDVANNDRITGSRRAPLKDSDSALDGKQPRIRGLVREEVRNNPFARGAKRAHRNNVVGDADVGQGVTVNAAVLDANGKPSENINKALNEAWQYHMNFLDARGRWHFNDLCALADQSLMESGEVLTLVKRRRNRANGRLAKIPLSIEMLEPDRLPMNSEWIIGNQIGRLGGMTSVMFGSENEPKSEKRRVHHGVEYDENGCIAGYFLLEAHPGDDWSFGRSLRAKRVDASEVIHYFDPERCEQTRGVSRFVAGINTLADLRQLYSWELIAAMAQATQALHFETGGIKMADYSDGGATDGLTDAHGNPVTSLEPGQILTGKGKVNFLSPNRPGGTFQPFVSWLTRAIAASVDMGYSTVAHDYSGGSFSSLRQEALEERRGYRTDQGLLSRHFVRRIWWEFVEACAVAGIISASDFERNPERYQRCEIHVPGWEYVNPLQEAQADAVQLANGMKDLDEVPNVSGLEPEDRLRRMSALKKLAKSLDLLMPWMSGGKSEVAGGDVGQEKPEDVDGSEEQVEAEQKNELEEASV